MLHYYRELGRWDEFEGTFLQIVLFIGRIIYTEIYLQCFRHITVPRRQEIWKALKSFQPFQHASNVKIQRQISTNLLGLWRSLVKEVLIAHQWWLRYRLVWKTHSFAVADSRTRNSFMVTFSMIDVLALESNSRLQIFRVRRIHRARHENGAKFKTD